MSGDEKQGLFDKMSEGVTEGVNVLSNKAASLINRDPAENKEPAQAEVDKTAQAEVDKTAQANSDTTDKTTNSMFGFGGKRRNKKSASKRGRKSSKSKKQRKSKSRSNKSRK